MRYAAALVLLAACTGESSPDAVDTPDAADVPDVAEVADAPADAAETRSGPSDWGPPKPEPLPCAIELTPDWIELAKPHTKECETCHNSIIPAPFMPSGGPQWLNPVKPEDTITALVLAQLLDPVTPSASLLITKPLYEWDGGVHHGGDGFFDTDSAEYADLVEFATRAQSCASQ